MHRNKLVAVIVQAEHRNLCWLKVTLKRMFLQK